MKTSISKTLHSDMLPQLKHPTLGMRTICFVTGCILFLAATTAAQKLTVSKTDFVYPSPQGIYVFCGNISASVVHPRGDTVGYRIERRTGKEKWMQIADVASVTTTDDFSRAVTAEKRKQWASFLKLGSVDSLWLYIREHPTLLSLPFGADRELLLPLGMLYLDKDVKTGTKYEYRVSPLLQAGQTGKASTSQPVTAGEKWHISTMVVTSVVETDSSVHIEWMTPKVRPTPHLYHVYRRMTGQDDFTLLPGNGLAAARHDSLLCIVYDENLRRNQQYEYYVVAEDLVGNLSPESEIATVYTVNFTRLPLPMEQQAIGDSMGIRLSWKVSGWDYVHAVRIFRSTDYEGPFEHIAEVPSTDTTYYDHSVRGMIRYYYRLRTVSFGGRESQMSMPFMGYWSNPLPPATPQGLTATAIEHGVELTWERNTDDDVAGYYVCRASDKEDSLLTISPLLQSNNYVDSSADLRASKEYRYAVVALNTSQQKSLFSNVAYARPLIKTNPAPPRSMHAYPRENSVALNWNDPRDYEPYVLGYAVYRGIRVSGEIQWTRLATMMRDPEIVSYFDSTAKKNQMYYYAVSSIDLFDNEGIKGKIVEAMIQVILPPPPADLHVSQQENGVLLEWEEMPEEEISQFVIYRNERGQEEQKLATVQYPVREFTDRSAKANAIYYYSVSTINTEGVEGDRSEKVYVIMR